MAGSRPYVACHNTTHDRERDFWQFLHYFHRISLKFVQTAAVYLSHDYFLMWMLSNNDTSATSTRIVSTETVGHIKLERYLFIQPQRILKISRYNFVNYRYTSSNSAMVFSTDFKFVTIFKKNTEDARI